MTTPSPVQALARYLEGRKPEIAKILPQGMNADRVVKTALMAALDNPEIGTKCSPVSIYRSVMQASLLGLTVGGGNQEAYLVPHRGECTLSVGYRGWVKCARRTEGIDIIRASVVYEMDELDITEFPPSVSHRPRLAEDRGALVGAIAAAYSVRDGAHVLYDFTFVSKAELDAAQRQAGKSPAWSTWGDEMRKKVAIRRLCKMLPTNADLDRLQSIEGAVDSGRVPLDAEIDGPHIVVEEAAIDAQTGEVIQGSPEINPPAQAPKSRTDEIKAAMLQEVPDYGQG